MLELKPRPAAEWKFGEPCPGSMNDGQACPYTVDVLVTYDQGCIGLCEGHLLVSVWLREDGKGGVERYEPKTARQWDNLGAAAAC